MLPMAEQHKHLPMTRLYEVRWIFQIVAQTMCAVYYGSNVLAFCVTMAAPQRTFVQRSQKCLCCRRNLIVTYAIHIISWWHCFSPRFAFVSIYRFRNFRSGFSLCSIDKRIQTMVLCCHFFCVFSCSVRTPTLLQFKGMCNCFMGQKLVIVSLASVVRLRAIFCVNAQFAWPWWSPKRDLSFVNLAKAFFWWQWHLFYSLAAYLSQSIFQPFHLSLD